MPTHTLTREKFDEAVQQLGLTEHEPIPGDGRRHFGNAAGIWGVKEDTGEHLLYVPEQRPL